MQYDTIPFFVLSGRASWVRSISVGEFPIKPIRVPQNTCYSTLRFANCRPVACYSSTLHFANDLVPSVELWYCTPVTCYSTLHFANALVIGIVVLSPSYLLEYVAFCQCQWYCWGWAGCWNVVPEGKPCPNLIVCTSLFSWANHQFAAYETVLAMLCPFRLQSK